ncbi:MAG: bifunctional nuclease family protein [Elusimicrobiales bacterium]|nr:bifunctional nuclease family protein [Elusimicrobiales bacterium]
MKKIESGPYSEARIYSIAASLTESIIFLDEINGSRILPIWIGPAEAQSIAIKLSGYPAPRPMTHDLLFNILKKTGLSIRNVCISDISNKTFFAYLFIEKSSNKKDSFKMDARPSDALALAVRFGCPILVHEQVFEKAQTLAKPISEEEVRQFKHNLSNLKPSDIINNLMKKKKHTGEDKGQDKDHHA